MKFSCSREEIQLALNQTRHAVKDKSIMTILEGILFNVYNHKLHLTATDLNIGITTEINVDSQEDGALVLNANLVFNIINRLSGDTVYFSSDDKNFVTIQSEEAEFNIAGMSADEFPKFPKPDTDLNFTVNSQELRNLINKVKFAAAGTEAQHPIIRGIKMEFDKKNLRMVAMDGFRLAIKNGPLDEETAESEVAIVSAQNLSDLTNILALETGEVTVNLSKSQIFFQINNTIFTSRLLEGVFFDYQQIIPKTSSCSFQINRQELLNSCERAILISSSEENILIRFDINSGKLQLSCKNDTGDFNDEIDIELEGKDLTTAFNTKYLIESLKAIDDDQIKLNFNGAVGPITMLPLENDLYTYLILPIRINQ